MSPKASVVIAVYNRESTIEKCLHSALNQLFSEDHEVIVVDDGSTDSTRKLLARFCDSRLVLLYNEKNQGASSARNRGIGKALGRYIAFLDSDCIAKANWLEEIIKPFDLDPAVMITAGKTIGPSLAGNYWQQINEVQSYTARKDGFVREAHSCNMGVRTSFIRENLFDESLPFSEDLDLCLRCLRNNSKIYYTHKAKVVHFSRSTFKSSLDSCFSWGAYNAFVRLKWQVFPFLNYGTYILLSACMCLCLGLGGHIFWKRMGWSFFCIYMILVLYIWLRPVNKNFLKPLFSFPVGLIFSMANCIGNLWGAALFVLKKR